MAGAATQTFRWLDDNGIPHYEDKVPPEATSKRRSLISPQGRELREIEPPKSPEQVQREQQLKQLRAQQERVLADQQAQDNALLRTYRTTDEMYRALANKLATLDGIIRITEGNRLRQKELLAEQERAAAAMERNGQAITPKQREVIDSIRRQITIFDEKIRAIQNEKAVIGLRFDKDISRLRALLQSRGDPVSLTWRGGLSVQPDRITKDEVSAIACTVGPICDQAWNLAREYVLKISHNGLVMETERILQTPNPVSDAEFGLTVTRLPGRGEQILFLDVRCRPSSIGEALCSGSEVSQVRANFKRFIEVGLAGGRAGAAN